MSKTEIVKKFITALQSGDMALAADCITDDFVFRGWHRDHSIRESFLPYRMNCVPL